MQDTTSAENDPTGLPELLYEPGEFESRARQDSHASQRHQAILWADPDAPSREAIEMAQSLSGNGATNAPHCGRPWTRRLHLAASALLGDPMGEHASPGARAQWIQACKAALGEASEIAIHGAAISAGDDLAWALGKSTEPMAFLSRLEQACGAELWAPKDIVGTVEPYRASLAERIACKACGPLFCSGSIGGNPLFGGSRSRLGRLGRWARGLGGLDPKRCAGALRDSAALCHFPAHTRQEDQSSLRLAMEGLFGADLAQLRMELAILGAIEGAQALADPCQEGEKAELLASLAAGAARGQGEDTGQGGSSGAQGRL